MSIYASLPGIGDIGDDETIGPPWIYQGSHILPSMDDPRGGSVGLAEVPSHITRDGRDDQPEDGRPWPWLRLSVVEDGVVIDVVINPVQARHLAAQLVAWADSTQEQQLTEPRPTASEITDDQLDALHAALDRVRALRAAWIAAGPPPIGTSVSRWWDRRLVQLDTALDEPEEQQ